ncbi:EKC/KEOPS complex subunit BUD32 [Astathelohania contejeani]|uniref:non-specific serine/threonine protein kinase n=1 Tax=Astathelohania contejeani TaxID=164912 RepID=A0ABQ7I2H2_9MICR|nr:EKC/KEOPS complex subunit BUD32 [Thelohania contejeani]
MKLIAQGAEAKLYECNSIIVKYRFSKKYRIQEIDTPLIKKRTAMEKRILTRLYENGIEVPKLYEEINVPYYGINEVEFKKENSICMEKINGIPFKDILKKMNENEIKNMFYKLGILVSRIHMLNVIHGDLTTLNFLVKEETLAIYVIDFGLSFISPKDEDKAVDLYVFEKAVKAAHPEKYLDSFYQGYFNNSGDSIRERLELVRLRGRKRENNMIG